jgi:biotin transport system substrate-specific component
MRRGRAGRHGGIEIWRSFMSSGVSSFAAPSTLVARLWPSREDARFAALRVAALLAFGTALLTLSAKIQVPFYPVPMTMQTFLVLVLGAVYGWRLAGATVALYLLEGAAGLPVFAGPIAGPAYLMGPTGGFLIGFLPAAMAAGAMAGHGFARSLLGSLATMTAGHAIIFAFGIGWLSTAMPFAGAWAVGFMPFLAATALKTALAAAAFQAAAGAAARRETDGA